jgi:hypothetical protein
VRQHNPEQAAGLLEAETNAARCVRAQRSDCATKAAPRAAEREYRLLAWEDIEYGAFLDPDIVKPVEHLSKGITVHEGSHETMQLTSIPAENSQQNHQ